MIRTLKSTISILLCLVMLLIATLAGCDEDDDNQIVDKQGENAADQNTTEDGNSIEDNNSIETDHNTDMDTDALADFYYEETSIGCTINGVIDKTKTSYIIPDGVTSIDWYAFCDCYNLMNITIPDGVTSIGEYAFSDCYSLKSVTIPNSVTSIGKGAFSGCSALTNITVPFVGATKNGMSNTHFGYIFHYQLCKQRYSCYQRQH